MPWAVEFHDDFAAEVTAMPVAVRRELLAHAVLLKEFGPSLGRPTVDTLAGSSITNLKELRFNADGRVWRVFFVFDRRRVAILLAGAPKHGVGQDRFYKRMIALAERQFGK